MNDLAYDRVGRGPALVLLHGLGGDRTVWHPVLDLLATRRDCIAVDLPGFGESPPLAGEAHPRALAGAVSALLAQLGLSGGRAHLAGNSLGGWVALEVALAGQAASATVIAPAGLWDQPLAPKPEIGRRLAKAARPLLGVAMRSSRARRAVLHGSMAHPERVPPADAAALVRAYADAPGFTAANRAMRAGAFRDLDALRVPVTLVWPEYDKLVAPVRSAPPHVRQLVLPGCGHVPMWDDPAAVCAVLLDGSADRRRAHQRRGGSGKNPDVRRT